MELSEAKNILKNLVEYAELDETETDAIYTVLKALDNSISKEYHEMVIKEQNDIIEDLKSQLNNCYTNEQHDMIVKALNDMIEFLKKQLENSISKDEVQNKVDEIANQTWYVADGEEAKRACMDELENLIN